MKKITIIKVVVASIMVLAVIGGGITTTVIKSSANKSDSVKSSKVVEKDSASKKEKNTEKEEIKKTISEEEAEGIVNDMLDYMHFAIDNEILSEYDNEEELLWANLFDCVYASDIEEIEKEDYSYYKEASEAYMKRMATIYGYVEDELPEVAGVYKDIIEYDKEKKSYIVNTNSDAPTVEYEVASFEIESDNDIVVEVGYLDPFSDEQDGEYESKYRVVLKELYPEKDSFMYYIHLVEEGNKKETNDSEDVDEDEADKDKETTQTSNKEIEDELAKILPLLEFANDEDYYKSKYSKKEKEEKLANMVEYYIYETYTIEEFGTGEQYKNVSKKRVESIASAYDVNFKELPDMEEYCNVKYDSAKEIYRFDTSGNSSYSIEDKINGYEVKEDGSIELTIGSYEMYSDTPNIVEEIADMDFVEKGSKYDELKIGERKYILKENGFSDSEYRFTIYSLEYIETEFDADVE